MDLVPIVVFGVIVVTGLVCFTSLLSKWPWQR
jgi:hypothetical protein